MPRKRKQQPIAVPTGTSYGQGQALADAQRAIPLPTGAPTVPSGPARTGGAPQPAGPRDPLAAAIAAASGMAPPVAGGLTRPSDRPGEPVTAGLPIGAGAGPEALGLPALPETDGALTDLIVAYQQNPSPALAKLIEVVRSRSMARQRTLAEGRNVAQRRNGRFL
jgi:hypothetical protein